MLWMIKRWQGEGCLYRPNNLWREVRTCVFVGGWYFHDIWTGFLMGPCMMLTWKKNLLDAVWLWVIRVYGWF